MTVRRKRMVKMGLKQIITGLLTVSLIGSGISPFVEANQLGTPFWLIIYLIVISGIALLNFKWFIELPLQLSCLLFTCHRYFPMNQAFSFSWTKTFLQTVLAYLDPVQRAEFRFLPGNIALVFIGLFMLMLVKLIISYELWMLPFLAVLSYLLILTVFNGTDHFPQIIGLLVTAFILSGWLAGEGKPLWLSQGIGGVALISCLILAWQLPIWLPQIHQEIQMKSQPFRASFRSHPFYRMIEFARGNGQSATTGFSENDSILGGSVIPNNEVVFLARQKNAHYWKVENKDRYSGRGWESSDETREVMNQERLVVDEGHSRYQESGQPIELTLPNPLRYIPKPQGMIAWSLPPTYRDNQALEYSEEGSRFYVNLSGDYPAESIITYDYFPPEYSIADLEGASIADEPETNARYLQLPDKLPERVRELAHQITANQSTGYEKVKALESYLKNSADFRYSLEEAEMVPDNRDYVDFFLFDSKIGYCEHFSSSMVVLARSLGIPARWAKGFSEGKVSQTHEDGTKSYRISNENAHAWAEIYFEGIGWVPFEPTKSFISSEQVALAATNQPQPEVSISSAAPVPSSESSSTSTNSSTTSQIDQTKTTDQRQKNKGQSKYVGLWLFGIGGSLVVIGLIFRRRLQLEWWLLKVTYFPNSFVKSYEGLLSLLEPIHRRHESETIRQYQEKIAQKQPELGEVFKEASAIYEEQVYGKNLKVSQMKESEQRLLLSFGPLLLNKKTGTTD